MLRIIITLIVIFTINCDCENSYYFDQSTKKCQKCQSRCSSCSNNRTCSNCREGYFLSSGICHRCSQQCKSCTSATRCQTCKPEYVFNLISQSFLPCPNNCNSCKVNTNCEICKIGYFMKDNSCVKCSSNFQCFNGIDQVCDQNDNRKLVVYITISILALLFLIGCYVCYRQNCKRGTINPNNNSEQTLKTVQNKPKNVLRLDYLNSTWKQSKRLIFKKLVLSAQMASCTL